MNYHRDRIPITLLPVPTGGTALSFPPPVVVGCDALLGFQRPGEWWHFSIGDQMWAWFNQQNPGNSAIATTVALLNQPTVAVERSHASTCRMWYYMYGGGGCCMNLSGTARKEIQGLKSLKYRRRSAQLNLCFENRTAPITAERAGVSCCKRERFSACWLILFPAVVSNILWCKGFPV